MGIIQKQSIQSTFIISVGFAIGALNTILIAPKILTPEQYGLTRIINEASVAVATLCTFGCLPIVYKFFPFYKSYLSPRKNDLPFLTLVVCMTGFVIMYIVGYLSKGLIIQKFSGRSPLFVQYSYLVYPYAFTFLLLMWLESFSIALKKAVISNLLKEAAPRLLFTLLLIVFTFGLLNTHQFFVAFSLLSIFPVIIIFAVLRNSGEFSFNPTISPVTRRLKGKMINFSLFLFGAQFLNLLSRTVDTFILSAKSERGLTDAAVFTIATYVVQLMEIPQRSVNSISIPILSESWKNKDMKNIAHIYEKSVANLLIIGLLIFCLVLLNIHNLASFLGKDYSGIESVVFFLGIGKLIDLGTGTNGQIIGTSNYWKVDFTTNVIYTIIALPLNYMLISHYGLKGGAYASLISLTFYNLLRYIFLWYKFKLQPYTWKDLLAVTLAAVAVAVTWNIPRLESVVVDTAVRTTVFCMLFLPAVFYFKISEEVNGLIIKYLGVIRNFLSKE